MRKILILLLLATALVPATAGTSWACSCLSSSMQTMIDRAEVVFTGTATDVSGDRRHSNVTFEVADGFKGGVSGEVILRTPASAAACGVVFEPGRSYTILGDYHNGTTIETTSCSGTKAGNTDLSRFGLTAQGQASSETTSGRSREQAPQPNWQRPAFVLVALLIGVGVLASTRRLRSRTPSTSDSP